MSRIAYIVRRTYFDATPNEDVARFDVEPEFLSGRLSYTRAYGDALDLADQIRAEQAGVGYAVIDSICADGTRYAG